MTLPPIQLCFPIKAYRTPAKFSVFEAAINSLLFGSILFHRYSHAWYFLCAEQGVFTDWKWTFPFLSQKRSRSNHADWNDNFVFRSTKFTPEDLQVQKKRQSWNDFSDGRFEKDASASRAWPSSDLKTLPWYAPAFGFFFFLFVRCLQSFSSKHTALTRTQTKR